MDSQLAGHQYETASVSPTDISRREFLRLTASGSLLGAAATLLAACGSTSQPTTPPPATSAPASAAPAPPLLSAASSVPVLASAKPAVSASAAASGQPKTGGPLRLAITGDISGLDGYIRSSQGLGTTWQVFDRLTQYDSKLKPQPMLAESWDLSSDAK